MSGTFDFIVVGAGSAGCAAAYGLANQGLGTIAVLEAGPTDAVPQVRIPFGLLYTMGSRRDWRFKSIPQVNAGLRPLKYTRGCMVGGSSSINSMVWFRGRRDDFDNWRLPGWRWDDVAPEFHRLEERVQPQPLPEPHPLSLAFGQSLGANQDGPPTPEYDSAGVFHVNMRAGRRWSAADAFLAPALRTGACTLFKTANVDRIHFEQGIARSVKTVDGRLLTARRGIVLCAGTIGSPAILMRSGIGPADHLQDIGVDVVLNLPGVGRNLHDHPSIGVHHAGPRSGYGLTLDQLAHWLVSPLQWLIYRRGRLTSNFVEAGAFLSTDANLAETTSESWAATVARAHSATRAANRTASIVESGCKPDCQVHFMPYMMGFQGRQITTGSGYFADVCLCRPHSRGSVSLRSTDPNIAPAIDPQLLQDRRDLHTLVKAFRQLRLLLDKAPFEQRKAAEVYPGDAVQSDEEIADYIRSHCGTAYHPVGTVRMGDAGQPLTPTLQVRGLEHLWVADASVMPVITSANTNAPSMMIGSRAAHLIAQAIKGVH